DVGRWPGLLRAQSAGWSAVLPTHRSGRALFGLARYRDQSRSARRHLGQLIRLGLLGGTFDPPHYGHLLMASEAAWQLHLERVLFLPARQNPLKRDEPTSDAEARCQMVQLAIADNPRFELSRLDLDRPPPSYTVDLLRGLTSTERELFFLVGADIL